MAIDPNALTLADYALISNDPLVKKITMSLYATPNLLKDIPLVTVDTNKMAGERVVDLSHTVNWGQINKVPVVTKSLPKPYEEQVFLIRNQFQFDRRLLREKNRIQDPVNFQVETWMKAFGYEFNYRYISNSHNSADANFNGDAPAGLRYRLDNPNTYGNIAEMKINAGGVDLSTAGLTQATGNKFIELVQTGLDYMGAPDGERVVIYINDNAKRRWETSLRILGAGAGFDTQRDNYDHPISKYKDAVIRDVGRKADQVTRIITNTETADGMSDTGGTFTSMYFVKYGPDDMTGWQTNALEVENLGIDPTNGIMHNSIVDWGVGLWQPGNRAVARIYNIKVA